LVLVFVALSSWHEHTTKNRRIKMPMKSTAQRKAMLAAAAGRSILGIPKKVGAEFVKADKGGKLPKRKGNRKS
jgi:hypothetical protein